MEENVEKESTPVKENASQNFVVRGSNLEDAQLMQQIENAKTKEELEPLYQQFNINNTKKSAIRLSQLNNLLDKVNQQAIERFTKRPDEISNKEVIDYMNAVQNQIERSQKIVDGVKDINVVQINSTQNNTINVNMGGDNSLQLDDESRNRITNIIADILKSDNKSEVIDVTPEKSDDDKCIINTDDDDFNGDE